MNGVVSILTKRDKSAGVVVLLGHLLLVFIPPRTQANYKTSSAVQHLRGGLRKTAQLHDSFGIGASVL